MDLAQPALATVLYVEDMAINILVMRALFRYRPQLQLVVATTGQEALHEAAKLQPVLLLLDLQLPDCHGADLLTRLRPLPGYRSAPAVAVTADDDFPLDGRGFVERWAKPLDVMRVLQRLDALVLASAGAQAEAMDSDLAAAMPRASELAPRFAGRPSGLPHWG